MEESPEVQNLQHLTLITMELIQAMEAEENKDIHEELIKEHIKQFSQNVLEEPRTVLHSAETETEWFNISRPLNWKQDLNNTVAVLDFFTYCCINCMHILPDLEALEEEFKPNESPVLVIGIHSPKFENEKMSSSVQDAISRHHVSHPVINDLTCQLWNSLNISCWPTIVIFGPSCIPLFVLVGEGHRNHMMTFVEATCKFFESQLKIQKFPLKPLELVKGSCSPLYYPGKVVYHHESLIISDSGNNRILICDLDGNMKDIIGCGKRCLVDGGYEECGFNNPQGLAAFKERIYVADTENHVIRMINTETKEVKTVGGTGSMSSDKEGGLLWTQQGISSPWDVCLAHSLDKYVKEDDPNLLLIAMAGIHQIWGLFLSDGTWLKKSFYPEGSLVRLAGSGSEENRNTSYPLKAGFAQPSGLTLLLQDDQQQVFIADSESSSIRQFTLNDGTVKRVVGGGRDPLDLFSYGDKDGTTKDALLQHPVGITAVKSDIFVADTFNHKIKKISKFDKKMFTATTISIEKSEFSELSEPAGLCYIKGSEEVAIADTNNHQIKLLNLCEMKIRELKLIFHKNHNDCDTVDSPTKDTIIMLAASQKKFLLILHLGFEEGLSFNQEVESFMTISHSDDVKVMNQRIPVNQLDVPIQMELISSGDSFMELCFNLFLCSSSGFCLKKKHTKKLQFTSSNEKEHHTCINVQCPLL